jgi:hypothetical protein
MSGETSGRTHIEVPSLPDLVEKGPCPGSVRPDNASYCRILRRFGTRGGTLLQTRVQKRTLSALPSQRPHLPVPA